MAVGRYVAIFCFIGAVISVGNVTSHPTSECHKCSKGPSTEPNLKVRDLKKYVDEACYKVDKFVNVTNLVTDVFGQSSKLQDTLNKLKTIAYINILGAECSSNISQSLIKIQISKDNMLGKFYSKFKLALGFYDDYTEFPEMFRNDRIKRVTYSVKTAMTIVSTIWEAIKESEAVKELLTQELTRIIKTLDAFERAMELEGTRLGDVSDRMVTKLKENREAFCETFITDQIGSKICSNSDRYVASAQEEAKTFKANLKNFSEELKNYALNMKNKFQAAITNLGKVDNFEGSLTAYVEKMKKNEAEAVQKLDLGDISDAEVQVNLMDKSVILLAEKSNQFIQAHDIVCKTCV